MRRLTRILACYLMPVMAAMFFSPRVMAQADASVFSLLDLSRPGLEKVAAAYASGDTQAAASALLDYYITRTGVRHPDVDPQNPVISVEEQKWADDGMKHIFFVHYGYQPSYHYGDDIDWTYWPVRDNELRWQLHRTKWWVPMGKAFRTSGDKKYVDEWMAQYLDWIRKNPLVSGERFARADVSSGEIPTPEELGVDAALLENERFAWRPLEVSDRLEFQIHQFAYFLPGMTPEFLTRFLTNYHKHATHITRNFSETGNHLLFEAQRLTFAGVYFPEFTDAPYWRAEGVGILNREIARQVYEDGMQNELDPHYHLEAINIFFNALQMMDANGYRGEFPQEYLDRVEKMIVLNYNISFPDYTNPIFSDAKLHEIDYTLPYYKKWTEVYPENEMIRWMATQEHEGRPEPYLSRAFKQSGMYVLRNGWDSDATVLVMKAGPPSFWHNQPDNGTFELWRKGRNFFPDSGSFVYAGDKEIMELRNWFRQTQVHNTLTLDGRDLEKTDSRCVFWSTDGPTDIVAIENPSYEGLTHRRSIFFVDREFYVIVDEAWGDATGEVTLNYHWVEGAMNESPAVLYTSTNFVDGNNMAMQVYGEQDVAFESRKGWVSRAYRSRNERPWYRYSSVKEAAPVRLITIIGDPLHFASGTKASFDDGFSAEALSLTVTHGGKEYKLGYEYQ